MSLKELPFPKALNIIRPSSPLIQLQDSSHSSSTASSSPSTLSSFSSYSNNNNSSRVQPTIVTPSNFAYFQNNWASFKSTNPVANTVGVNPHRFLQRPRSNSSLSKSTFFSAISVTSSHASEEEEDEEEEEEDLDSIDGLTDEEDDDIEDDNESEEDDESEVEDEPTKIVAKVKHGTIMNGKGEFVSKGSSDEQNSWLDEARANRKIADLEIEKASLLVLNTTLEAKLRQQTSQIVELQKRLQMNEGPLTPVSDKHVDELFDDDENTIVSSTTADEDDEIETDQVFQRIKSMLEGLILQAEVALLQKSKQSGKVLQEYNFPMVSEQEKRHNVEETLHKLTVRTMSPPPIKRSTRRVSDTSKPASAKMSRNLSRQSSPPVMMTSTSPRPFSPPPTQRSSSPRYSSQLRKSQDLEKPKWNY